MLVRSTVLHVAVTIFVVVVLLLALRIAGSIDRDYTNIDDSRLAVAKALIPGDSGGPDALYVGFDDGDPSPQQIQALSELNPRLKIRPYSERSDADDQCGEPGYVLACRKDNYLLVHFRTMLLWRTASVSWHTAGCHADYIVVKSFGEWRLFQEPWSAVCT